MWFWLQTCNLKNKDWSPGCTGVTDIMQSNHGSCDCQKRSFWMKNREKSSFFKCHAPTSELFDTKEASQVLPLLNWKLWVPSDREKSKNPHCNAIFRFLDRNRWKSAIFDELTKIEFWSKKDTRMLEMGLETLQIIPKHMPNGLTMTSTIIHDHRSQSRKTACVTLILLWMIRKKLHHSLAHLNVVNSH